MKVEERVTPYLTVESGTGTEVSYSDGGSRMNPQLEDRQGRRRFKFQIVRMMSKSGKVVKTIK